MQSLINIDQQVFSWFNSLVGLNQVLDWVIKVVSVYAVYTVPFIMLFFWFYKKTEERQNFLMNLFISVMISWQIIAKYLGEWINRSRPDTFAGTKEVLFHPPSYSFPSDHALFFAFITAYLYLGGYKKMGNIALAVSISVSLFRVIGGFHWPGDILAGWI